MSGSHSTVHIRKVGRSTDNEPRWAPTLASLAVRGLSLGYRTTRFDFPLDDEGVLRKTAGNERPSDGCFCNKGAKFVQKLNHEMKGPAKSFPTALLTSATWFGHKYRYIYGFGRRYLLPEVMW